MKRLCVFVTYDAQNRLDSYIGYMLRELRQAAGDLVVVCNCQYITGLSDIQPYADKIYVRENIGFDAGGFKDALCTYIGWDKIKEYDELLLVNDSLFGPFCPITDIFDEMDKRECDFWGLSACRVRLQMSHTSFAPEHIQSFFLVFRSKLLHAPIFESFWESMPYYSTYTEIVNQYEIYLTDFFSKAGYSYDCYADAEANFTSNEKNNFNQYWWLPNELVRKRNFPFLKKKSIDHNSLSQQTQETIPLVFDYIKNETNYDINLIYENIIRLMNISDMQRRLCLHYILPDNRQRDRGQKAKTAIVIAAEYCNCGEYVMEYVKKISGICKVFVLSKSEAVIDFYRQNGLTCMECIADYKDRILHELEVYDFVGVVHDADVSSDRKPNYVGKSRLYHIWENMVKDSGYIDNIIHLFDENEKLGLLTIPRANFEDYFGDIGNGWNGHFDAVKNLAEKYQIQCNLDYMKPPFEQVHNFWIRGSLLQFVKKADTDLRNLLPWMWCYIAQDRGYLSGIVECKSYAEMNAINQQYYLDVIGEQIRRQFGGFQNLQELQELLSRRGLVEYCQKYESVYVYGTGYIAERFLPFIPNAAAYIVSDGQKKLQKFNGKEVFYLSEIDYGETIGLVVCLDRKNQYQVIPQIVSRGFKNYFCV